MTGLGWAPLLPWWAIGALAVAGLAAAGWALWRGLSGWLWRGLGALALALALAGPVLDRGERKPLSDVVILIEDRSASQTLPGRAGQTTTAADLLAAAITARPGTELRRLTVGDDADGTLLGTAIARAVAAEPAARLAGVIVVTDGRLADAAILPSTVPAPVHVLLTGAPGDWDRRLVVDQAPAFGVIGQPVTLRLRVEDQGAVPPAVAGKPAILRLSVDGGPPQVLPLTPGQQAELPITPSHAGQNVVSAELEPPGLPAGAPGQLTDRNDSALLQVQGVRDRLRVLLVSGEPHPGERTWRNLLKSDPNVDLVHFTILRPPDKFDGVPQDELALIAFPTDALFNEHIRDFDLIVFDRYRVRGILPPEYFANIRSYVEGGGALLVSAGPEMEGVESLSLSPLGPALPARPTGRMIDEALLPQLTDAGRRHPITADLPGAPDPDRPQGPHWGRWLRAAEVMPDRDAQVLMQTPGGAPLLITRRQGQGRVALLASDQVWLWGRGFEGGGPQLELLRRIAHWEMKEPTLEEESLSADVRAGSRIEITRRTLGDAIGPLRITAPDGSQQTVALAPSGRPGLFSALVPAAQQGLYRLEQENLTRIVAVGPAAPREFEQTVASAGALAPLAQATHGAVLHLSDGVPELREVRAGRPASGESGRSRWIGLLPREAVSLEGITRAPLLPAWSWLVIIGGLMLAGWIAESGRSRNG